MCRFDRLKIISVILTSLIFLISLIQGFDKTDPNKPCTDCHASKVKKASPIIRNEKYLHSPVQKNDCAACHIDSSRQAKITSEELCYECHDAKKFKGRSHRHPSPGAENNCLFCHEPHSSRFEFLLKGETIPFCQSCHINIKKNRSHPMGKNIKDMRTNRMMTCTSTCHNVHRSDFPKLIAWKHRELCTKCHTDKLR